MKTIKSVLSLAAAVFIGSSVWAVEETIPYTFASGAERVPLERSVDGETTWTAWSDDPTLVSITIEGGSGAGTSDNKVTFSGKVAKSMLNLVPNPKKGATSVYLKNGLGDSYTVNARVDVVQCTSIERKHCADENDPQAWFEIDPEKYPALVPDGNEANHWGFDHAYSLDEGVAKIKVVDGKFRLYAPADGKDGTTRCIFIKDENDVLENDAKIYMFYVTVSTVELEKWLTFPEDEDKAQSNATLNIRAHYLNNVKEEITPKVLFVGTGCGGHDLEKDTIVRSLNAITPKAAVDVYLYKPSNKQAEGGTTHGPNIENLHFDKGHEVKANEIGGANWDVADSGAHTALTEFYNLFYSIATNETKRYQYDYIVMEFDGTRIASAGTGDTYAYNRKRELYVAEWLNEYYEGKKDSANGRIVWVVDADKNVVPQEGGTLDEDGLITKAGDYFRPFDAYYGGNGANRIESEHFRALLGLLNPWLCLDNKLFATDMTGTALSNKIDVVCGSKNYELPNAGHSPNPVTWELNVGETYAHQAYYNDPGNLENFLAERIKVTSYSADITDNVETQGLSFVSSPVIYGTYDTNAVAVGNVDIKNWSDLTKTTTGMKVTGTVKPDMDHNSISGHVDNVTKEFWTWIQIDLADDGAFRGGAVWDPTEEKFFRDPNLNTNLEDVVHGEAALTLFYDIANPDEKMKAWATTLAAWPFDKLPLEIVAEGVKRVYNGEGTNATVVSVKSGDNDITDATITAIYSADKGKTWSEPEAFAQEKFVNVTNLQVKLIAFENDHYLTATSGPVTVEITPRPVMLEAKSAAKVKDGDALTESGFNIVPSDDDDVAEYVPDYGFVGTESVTAVTTTGSRTEVGESDNVITPGSEVAKEGTILANYDFKYRNGKLGVISADPTVQIYDGKGHSIEMQLGGIDVTSVEYSWTKNPYSWSSDSNKVHAAATPQTLYYKATLADPYVNTSLIGSSTITITQRVVTVYANETNKVYGVVTNSAGKVTGVKPDPVFSWHADLSSAEEIGEEDDVLAALLGDADAPTNNLKRVAEDAATQAKYGPETSMEDVLYRDPLNYKHYAVITTNKPFEVEIDGFRDYRVEFVSGDFKIFPTNCVFAAESGTFDYVGIYDGKPHTIDLIVLPGEDGQGRKTTVSFSTNEVDWTTPIPYDEEKKWRAAMPKYTHVTSADGEPVYVKASNLPNLYETNMVAYVTITQRIVYVTADYAEKVYDGEPLTKNTFKVTAATEDTGFVGSEGFANLETQMTEDSTITNAGETDNKISATATYNWKGGTLASDYIVKTAKNTLKVTTRPIVPGKPGDDPEENKSLAWITGAEKVYDGVATGVVAGVKGIATKDLGLVKFVYSETDPTAKKFSLTAQAPSGKKTDTTWSQKYTNVKGNEEVRTVWCTVSAGENYTPCTVSAEVLIKRRPTTLTAGDLSKDYGADDPDPNTATVTTNGVIAADAGKDLFIYTMSMGSHNENPGKKTGVVKISGEKNQGNYTLTFVNGSLTIGPKPPSPHNPCHEEDPDPVDVARVYQVQFNTYTTKGKVIGGDTISGGQCGEDTTLGCTILRGRDKTVIRGYVFICADSCELKDYDCAFCDVTRRGVGTVGKTFQVNFCNAIGANLDQAEISWDFEDTFTYDTRSQKYELTGSGYGKVKAGATLFFDNLAGYFAGTAEGSYDFTTPKTTGVAECVCERSKVVTCEKYDSDWRAVLEDSDTVAFGAWKMKFNANASLAMLTHDPTTYFLGLLKKMFK